MAWPDLMSKSQADLHLLAFFSTNTMCTEPLFPLLLGYKIYFNSQILFNLQEKVRYFILVGLYLLCDFEHHTPSCAFHAYFLRPLLTLIE